jgi:hypothetical protein
MFALLIRLASLAGSLQLCDLGTLGSRSTYLSSPCIPSLVLCITCLVPALYPLLSCIPCLGSAPQYILCAYSVHSFPVCITSTSILASLRCTCFDIARQILSTPCRHSGQTPHRPRRTLWPTDRNSKGLDLYGVLIRRRVQLLTDD